MEIITPKIEMDFGAGFVDVSSDVISEVRAEWGVHGSDPKDRVADVGTMSFDLDNNVTNSGGKRGYYSPGHVDARPGFGIGTRIRLSLTHGTLAPTGGTAAEGGTYGTKVKWVGTIESLRIVPGVRDPKTAVTCVDWMDEAARSKTSKLAVQVDVQSDFLFTTLVNSVPRQPPGGTRTGSGSDTYPFALDNTRDESSKILSELQKLALSEYGFVYVSAGQAVFEGRRSRGGAGAIRYAMNVDDEIVALSPSHGRDEIINRVQVSIHPRRRDAAATTVLFNLGSPLQVFQKTSVKISCPYRDPNQQAQRVGGVDMVQPVATTDYLFNTLQDGTGVNLTSTLTVTAVFGGNTADVTIANDGVQDGYVTKLQLRGRGLYDFEPVLSEQEDSASQTSFGENVYGYDMPYQSNPVNAVDLASFILFLNKNSDTRIASVSFLANWDLESVEQTFNLEISDRISITAPELGLSALPFYVNGVRMEVRMTGVVLVTWDLAPVDQTQFWLLEVAGRTELDQTTVLGYGLFVPGWILDTSQLGTDTFLG